MGQTSKAGNWSRLSEQIFLSKTPNLDPAQAVIPHLPNKDIPLTTSNPGFTLIEIIIILVILTISSVLFLNRMDFFRKEDIRQGLRRVQAITTQTRNEAMLYGQKRCLIIDLSPDDHAKAKFTITSCSKERRPTHPFLSRELTLLGIKKKNGLLQESGQIKISCLANGLCEQASFFIASSDNKIYQLSLQPFDPQIMIKARTKGQSSENWF